MLIRKLIILSLFLLCACEEKIVHNLTESGVNRLVARLDEVGIDSSKEKQTDGRWALLVDRSSSLKAIKYLDNSRMLKEQRPSSKGGSSLILSKDDQRFRYERALSEEIEYTLISIDGVLESRVHLNIPRQDPFFGKKLDKSAHTTASVLLVATERFVVENEGIKSLVAGAAGVLAEHVSVLVNRVRQEKPKEFFPASGGTAKVEDTESFSDFSPYQLKLFMALLLVVAAGAVYWWLRKRRSLIKNKKVKGREFSDVFREVKSEYSETLSGGISNAG